MHNRLLTAANFLIPALEGALGGTAQGSHRLTCPGLVSSRSHRNHSAPRHPGPCQPLGSCPLLRTVAGAQRSLSPRPAGETPPSLGAALVLQVVCASTGGW